MKKSSLVLGLILSQFLAPHSQASHWRGNPSGLVETNASLLGVAGAHNAICPRPVATQWNKPAVYKDVRLPDSREIGQLLVPGNSELLFLDMWTATTKKHETPLQDVHPVARRALGHAFIDAKPEEALRMCITHSVGERHRESAVHHVRLLDRQPLVDILNMMCVVARNRDAVVGRTSRSGTLKKPLLDWQDPFVEGSIFVSRAPMKSIAMKKPHDEETQ